MLNLRRFQIYLSNSTCAGYYAEVNLGGVLGRHDLGIEQLGARTVTELAFFNLAGAGQCLDLHSSVNLSHEEGKTDQVHKCIVSSASGKGVFDGNVKARVASTPHIFFTFCFLSSMT